MKKIPTQSSERINQDMDLGDLRYLMKHIVQTISLPDFIESETGEDIVWNQIDVSGKCCCPLHREGQPSFHLNLQDDNVWVYHCFGCEAKGHVIHFCKEYHGLRNKLEAINYICQKYKIQNTSDLILEGIKQVGVKIDEQRVLENQNILLSNQCRMLLRKNYNLHSKWVASTYKELNVALAANNGDAIRQLDANASKRMHMKEMVDEE